MVNNLHRVNLVYFHDVFIEYMNHLMDLFSGWDLLSQLVLDNINDCIEKCSRFILRLSLDTT